MNTLKLGLSLSLLSVAALLGGCASGEDYQVSGEVSAAQAVSDPIVVEFFEADATDTTVAPESVLKIQLDALGQFDEKINVDPASKILVRAIADADGDGACSEGELWAEASALPKEDGTVDPLTLELAAAACPTAPTAD
jgi:hypothetical protein